jgi:hypothetical protein
VSWCFVQAAAQFADVTNPMQPTRSALACWRDAPDWAKTPTPAVGAIVVWDHGGGLGHVGLVEGVYGDKLVTIEGNTNVAGSREGDGVYRHTDRRVSDPKIVGYVDYGLRRTENLTS